MRRVRGMRRMAIVMALELRAALPTCSCAAHLARVHARKVPVLLQRPLRPEVVPGSPGADVAGGEPSPGADVAGASPVPVQMWQRRSHRSNSSSTGSGDSHVSTGSRSSFFTRAACTGTLRRHGPTDIAVPSAIGGNVGCRTDCRMIS